MRTGTAESDGGRAPDRSAEVELSGVLAEFRIALTEEISAARKSASSSAVSLVNGRLIGQVGSGFQYAFSIDNVLNLPGDAPGDLMIPGQAPIEVTIVSVSGLTVTVSVSRNLGGFVPAARLQSNLTMLMRKLIERIEAMATTDNPCGDRLLGLQAVLPSSPAVVSSLRRGQLNEYQQEAVASAIGRDTTFVWGPPGTGKTQTIGAIGASLVDEGRSVLVVSHTNTAVDGALVKIHDSLIETDPQLIADGAVIRIGDPADQRVLGLPDLLLGTHVERRSELLASQRDDLSNERQALVTAVVDLNREIAIAEWVVEVATDLITIRNELSAVQEAERLAAEIEEEVEGKRAAIARLLAAEPDADRLAPAERRLSDVRRRGASARASIQELDERIRAQDQAVSSASANVASAEELEPYLVEIDALPDRRILVGRADTAKAERQRADRRVEAATTEVRAAEELHAQTLATSALTRRFRGLPAPEDQETVVIRLRSALSDLEAQAEAASERSDEATAALEHLDALRERVVGHEDLPRLADAEERHASARTVLADLKRARAEQQREAEAAEATVVETEAALEAFTEEHGCVPSILLRRLNRRMAEIAPLDERCRDLRLKASELRDSLHTQVRRQVDVLIRWGLADLVAPSAEENLDTIEHARTVAEARTGDVGSLRAEQRSANRRISKIDSEIEEIDEKLRKVEETVISEAKVIATTLTRAYLREAIQSRRFDTVVLDEASMAPLPALWIAASLADRGVVAVGDFRQLPPIVLSEHELAKKWLGRDVFEAADVAYTTGGPAHLAKLRRQYRMRPEISEIANTLVYGGALEDDPSVLSAAPPDWYDETWGHDCPVLIADTERADAWVTPVARGSSVSRLNFLSATICVDIAEQMLRADREAHEIGGPPRIMIVCPYRPHSQFLNLLIEEQGLTDEVRAGTAHTFQGAEADVVILDLVNDDPHWRIGLFTPDRDEDNRRLLNVALTRARTRLVVVGDLAYTKKLAKKAFIGRELIPLLEDRGVVVDALDCVPTGLSARTVAGQTSMFGGSVEADHDRLVVNQDQFFPLLIDDLANASDQVVIYSPFLTQTRIGLLEAALRASIDRGVLLIVVTKAHGDRKKRELSQYRMLERQLEQWGVVVVHKKNMHEKLVFVDDDLIWSGSLNPLSFSDTQEVMERRRSRKVASDYAKTVGLEHIVGTFGAEDSTEVRTCPICGAAMELAEGSREPFYFCCPTKDCYRRNVGDPLLRDGRMPCRNCGGELEYRGDGKDPSWRCLKNKRHRQKVVAGHLRLPAMRDLVPKSELRKLERHLGLAPGSSPQQLKLAP